MKRIIFTEKAPAPIGPYSQGVLTESTLYVSGQIPLNVQTGQLIMASIEEQTKQVMENIGYVLEEAGMGFDNIVKATIFITNMDDFAKINQVYGEYFSDSGAPARETVQVSRLPKDVNIEISVIAIK